MVTLDGCGDKVPLLSTKSDSELHVHLVDCLSRVCIDELLLSSNPDHQLSIELGLHTNQNQPATVPLSDR